MLTRLLLFSICIFTLISCTNSSSGGGTPAPTPPAAKPEPPRLKPKPTQNISLGKDEKIGGITVKPSTGSNIKLTVPRTAIDGTTINVPPSSYKNNQDFQFTYQPITSHDLGDRINPLTPMIHVENGGKYSQEVLTIKIPVKVPKGHFAMGFYYDEKKKRLEPMGFLKQDDNSVTLATRHFSKFFVSSIPIEKLRQELPLMTDYEPGSDDWIFPNWGSTIAPGGHCAGQSATSIWYFLEKSEQGERRLWNNLDNNNQEATPSLWKDDTHGYKFASVIQTDMDWTNWRKKLRASYQIANPQQTWLAFAYAIKVTNEPQLVFIDTANDTAAHAMIIYGVDETGRHEGELLIADPNFPGDKSRRISFTSDYKLIPYNSAVNAVEAAKGNGIRFDYTYFVGNTAFIDFPQIANRWDEVLDGSIGKDKFLDCEMHIIEINGTDTPVKDNYWNTSDAYVDIYFLCKNPDGTESGGANLEVHIPGQAPLSSSTIYRAYLKPEEQKIGFYLTDAGQNYIDFKWVTLSSKPLQRHSFENSYQDSIRMDENYYAKPSPYRCGGYFEAVNISDPTQSGSGNSNILSATVVSTFPTVIKVQTHCDNFWSHLSYTHTGGNTSHYNFIRSREILYLTTNSGQELKAASDTGTFLISIDKTRAKRVEHGNIRTNMFIVSFHVKTRYTYNDSIESPDGKWTTPSVTNSEFFNTFFSITIEDPSLPSVEEIHP